MYEAPISVKLSSTSGSSTGHSEYELPGLAVYEVPNMYEYATLGPNGAMVIHFALSIYGSCPINDCKEFTNSQEI